MSSRPSPPLRVRVVAAIVADADPSLVPATAAAVGQQVYEPTAVVVVGGGSAGKAAADGIEARWSERIAPAMAGFDRDITYVWLLRAGVVPRAEALEALINDMERVQASVGGSKLLDAAQPDRLLSVGIATDVFDVPYRGLDEGEIDQGQFDVIRDVAAVNGESLVVRRDLAVGLGGFDERLAPEAAAIDFCQRARLRGARIVVVPSSEVLVPPAVAATSRWRETGGRLASMMKVYSPLTLLWALPGAFLTGILEAIVAPFLGRWTLFDWIAAWLWALARLPGTLADRRRARRHRVAGDTELFRYQLRGSTVVRELWEAIDTRLGTRVPEDRPWGIASLGDEFRRPAVVTGLVVFLGLVIAARVVWSEGLPAVGYALPLPFAPGDGLVAYAGGWNPAGLGSIEPVHPGIGFVSAVQYVLFGEPGLTRAVLTIGAAAVGILGTARLLRGLGIETVSGLLAGLVLVAGPAARSLTADGYWLAYLAMGLLPWAVRSVVAAAPRRWPRRLGRVAAAAWLVGAVGLLAPPLFLVPLGAAALWIVIGDVRAWRAGLIGLAGTVVAVPLLLPWLAAADLRSFLESGSPAFWEPGLVLTAAAVLAAVGIGLAAARPNGAVAAWGALLVVGGGLAARSADLGAGSHVESAGLVLASLGLAVVTGASLEMVTRLTDLPNRRRLGASLGLLGGVALLVSTVLVVAPGRLGFPSGGVEEALRFTAAQEVDPAASRVLLVGEPAAVPGDVRLLDGAGYRVVAADGPTMLDAWLPDPQSGDEALETALRGIIAGDTFRAGEVLSEFGIRWIVALGESPFVDVFQGQLDLVPLGGLDDPTFVSEAEAPVRAVTDTGIVWSWTGRRYEGPHRPGGTVLVADNANTRWEPEPWQQASWANTVRADLGYADFDPIPRRRNQAVAAVVLFGVLLVVSAVGRRFT